jgi:hypothetical protein
MERISTIAIISAVTVAAASAIWLWSLRPLGGGSYLSSTTESDADIIRRYWPHRLIEPEWVSATQSTLISWTVTETLARLSVVGVSWFMSAGVAVYILVKGKKLPQKA